MKSLTLCKLNADCTVYKNLCLYTSRKQMPQGTKCVFLRLEEGTLQAEVLFEGMEGSWRVQKEYLTHVCSPLISFKSESNQYRIDLSHGFKLEKAV